MAQVTWSFQALHDLEDIRIHVAFDRPLAAERLAERLRAAAAALDTYPEGGRPISQGRRELAHVWPYLIRYRVTADSVRILEVRHAARRPG
ncbi:MAG: type II toxin-antitoxin system RelE/ParE family toxin [Caulobacter sp.]|nr:type II toxin-antitoxin system RelE/ParE family toxin [Caulobacter sp.]